MKDSSDVGDSLFGSGILSNCWSFNNISYGSSSVSGLLVSPCSDDVATFSTCEDDDWRAAVLEKILVHAEFVRLFCRCVRSNSDDVIRRKATAWSIFSVELLQMVANAAADDDDDDGKSNNRRAVTKHLHSCGVIVLSHLRLYLLMPHASTSSPPVICDL